MTRQWYLIGYDVRDAKRLRRVAKILKGYGHRVQFSFFKVQAVPRQIERLRWELSKVLEDEDHLLIVGLCPRCAQNVEEQSGDVRWDPEPPNFEIVGGAVTNPSSMKPTKAKTSGK